MSRTLKTVLTVLICAVCALVSFCCVCYYHYFRTEYTDYRTGYEIQVQLKEAVIEPFDGEAYQEYQKEGYSLYQLYLTVENKTAYQSTGDALYLSYLPIDSYHFISELGRYYFSEGEILLPAGREAIIRRILYVPEDCGRMQVKYHNYRTEEEQILEIEVPQAWQKGM